MLTLGERLFSRLHFVRTIVIGRFCQHFADNERRWQNKTRRNSSREKTESWPVIISVSVTAAAAAAVTLGVCGNDRRAFPSAPTDDSVPTAAASRQTRGADDDPMNTVRLGGVSTPPAHDVASQRPSSFHERRQLGRRHRRVC